MNSIYRQIVHRVDQASYAGVVITMAAMTILVTAQVVTRYLFDSSIDSAESIDESKR